MKSKFPGYYRPTNEEFADMWQKCIFVLDTNNLLDFYRFSDETVKQYFDLLEKISDRLWIPYQIALEYQRNRLEVIIEQASVYEKLSKIFRQTLESVDKTINSLGRHAASKTDIQALNSRIKKYLQKIIADLDASYSDNLGGLTDEKIHNKLASLFKGKVGETYDSKKMQEIYTLGRARYDNKVPPGFEDDKEKVEDFKKYGDLVLWLQIIDYAKVEKKPIVFITNDTKEDWWEIRKGRTIGPRPELRQEMRVGANVDFYIYTSEEFLRYAQQNLKIDFTEAGIKEVREVVQQNTEKKLEKAIGLVQLPPDLLKAITRITTPEVNFSAFSRDILAAYTAALDQNNTVIVQALKPVFDIIQPSIYSDNLRQLNKLIHDITQRQLLSRVSGLPSPDKTLHAHNQGDDEEESNTEVLDDEGE